MEFSAQMIAAAIGGKVVGDQNATVTTFSKIEEGHKGSLSFLANPKYEQYLYTTASTIAIVAASFEAKQQLPPTLTIITVDDPYASFAKLLELYVTNKPRKSGIHPTAVIDQSAKIGEGCYIGAYAVIEEGAVVGNNAQIYPHVYVGDRCHIGDGAILYSGVKIYEGCVLGNRVTIHSGAVVGADGFGFAPQPDGSYEKIPQIGNVVIEDDVEIGANTCIDRSTMGSTRIGRGVKLDNLIQLAHNVEVGENTVMASQVGVAGSSKIGRNCMIGGQAGVAGHIVIGNRVNVGSKAGISNNTPDGQTMMGMLAIPAGQYRRVNAVMRHLPELNSTINRLEKELKALKEQQ